MNGDIFKAFEGLDLSRAEQGQDDIVLYDGGTIPYRGGHLGYAVLSYTWHYTYDQTTTFNTQFVITHSLQTHYIKANIGRSKQTNQTCKFRVSKYLIGLVNSY